MTQTIATAPRKPLSAADVKAILAKQAQARAARRAQIQADLYGDDKPAPAANQVAPAAASAPKPKATPAAPQITGAQVNAAAERARAAERERWGTVFASEHSKGRERACVALLMSGNHSTAQIVAALPKLPTDAATANEIRAEKTKVAGTVWEQAIAANNPGHKPG